MRYNSSINQIEKNVVKNWLNDNHVRIFLYGKKVLSALWWENSGKKNRMFKESD